MIDQSNLSNFEHLLTLISRTAAILDGHGGVRPLATIIGNDPYQAYIRQGLWSEMSAVLQSGKLDDHAQQLLEPHSPPTLTKIQPLLHELKSQLLKHIGQDPFNVVLGVSGSFQSKHRSEIRSFISQHLGLDVTILASTGQPALATVTFDLHDLSRETTVLVVDYNHASLDITLAVTVQFMTHTVAHVSLPLLGEDFLSLKLAARSSNDIKATDYDTLRSHARAISQRRMTEVDSTASGDNFTSENQAIESTHFNSAIENMLELISRNTHTVEITGPNWKPVLSDLSHILISGDASRRGFKRLRQAIAAEKSLLAGLLDLGLEAYAPPPGWISAQGAAKSVQQRRFDDFGKWNWHMHDEL
ncbi:MAG: hypothetical protein Q9215_001630 [Flavoplaca cf. flavocitrina]